MEGQEFLDVNQLLQRAVVHENHTKDHRSYNRFKENNSKEREKAHVNCVSKESSSEEDNEVCVVEWVDTPKEKPVSCSFLRPNPDKKDEVKFTFDVSKCDKLFDVLAQGGGVIRLSEGHVVPSTERLAKRKYCKWHDSYSHSTNYCNYFCR
jgi:hypothetical protein